MIHYALVMRLQRVVQAAVRAEAYTSLEPVRRLPQVLAAALPVTDVTIAGMAQAGPLECALSSGERDWLQSTLKQQLEAASEQIIASQVLPYFHQPQPDIINDLVRRQSTSISSSPVE